MLFRMLPFLLAAALHAQSGEPKFDVASIKPNHSDDQPYSNFPLGPGDVYVRNGGVFQATGLPLISYIAFAYKIIGNQSQYLAPQLPEWAKTDRYDIHARAASDPGKDGMRLMMRALLAERFHLVLRYEEREVPVFGFVLTRPGKMGPQLQAHSASAECPTEAAPTSSGVEKGKPVLCNGIFPLPPNVPGRIRFGGRNVTLAFIADTFSAGVNLGRPIVDRTGLTGTFDFTLEWNQQPRNAASPDAPSDPNLLSFEDALREQFGIKLAAQKGPLRVVVVDRVERPTPD